MADYDLGSLDGVRTLLQKQDVEINQDGLIEQELERASWLIMERCGRFLPTEDNADKRFVIEGGRRPAGGYTLDLFPYYARAIDAVVVDPDGSSPQSLAVADFRARPVNALDGMYRYLKLPGATYAPETETEVEVTGDWGFTTVPGTVKQACEITVVEWLRKDVQAFSTTYLAAEDRVDRPEAIPIAAKRMLHNYWRERQG